MPASLLQSNMSPLDTFRNPLRSQHRHKLQSPRTSLPASPEVRPVDLQGSIPEEEEDTGSEHGNEPLTPTDIPKLAALEEKLTGPLDHNHSRGSVKPQLHLKTSAMSPSMSVTTSDNGHRSATDGSTQTPKTPTRPRLTSRDSGIKRAVSGFFRRNHSSTNHESIISPDSSSHGASHITFAKFHRKRPTRGMSVSDAAMINAMVTSSDCTPRASEELNTTEASQDDMFGSGLQSRTSTGFSIRESLARHRINFAQNEKEQKDNKPSRPHRTTSVDFQTTISDEDPRAQLPPRQVWGMAADTGVGLKSRRLSLSLPDGFMVDVVDLYSEFADQSKLVGRRGKSIGKGATAHVRLMNRKGGYAGEVYAVKEFRGKSSNEKADDYEKKVKSEFTIAKSVHHPSIVETIRLCTYNGRWNHVMEFCDQGDLFSLVSQKYLSKGDHLVDRLCLFKQLVQGLYYLHAHGIAHRDVKLENLLITKDSKLKITDFGVSEVFSGIHPGLRSASGQCGKDMGEIRLCDPGMCGSPPYVAPEVIEKKNKYDPRPLDVWGAAVVMLCMAANGCLWQEAKPGSSPMYDDLIKGWTKWNNRHSEDSNAAISESDYPHVSFFDQHINPPALRRLLLNMLNPDPSKRASIEMVAKNRWLKNVECCQIESYDDCIDTCHPPSAKKKLTKIVHHNHLPPTHHFGHKLVRLPGSTDMY